MSSADSDGQRKESLMSELNALFAPPTLESFGKKGLVGIPSARRAKKQNAPSLQTDSSYSASSVANGKGGGVETNSPSGNHHEDPSWRKPRPNCHDFCDSCNCTEGDRLVCDQCPASFHLECLDPPLEADKAPTGVWYCHRCTMLSKDEDVSSMSSGRSNETGSSKHNKLNASDRNGSNGSSCNASSSNVTALPRRLFSARGLHGWMASSSKSVSTNDLAGWLSTGRRTSAPGEGDLKNSLLSSLWDVVHYARFQNPKEFELPKDLVPGIKIPGSYKTLAERKAKPIIDMENGQIPKPIRRCYMCARTCFHAPIISCDYCSSCFHLECLDPPLSQFPPRSDRWMCPLHAEHVVDRYLVKTIRLSERIEMWNHLAVFNSSMHGKQQQQRQLNDLDGATHEIRMGAEDEASVLTELMQVIRRGRMEENTARNACLALSNTVTLGGSIAMEYPPNSVMRIVVPGAVKALYAKPVQRLPRLEEIRPINNKTFTKDTRNRISLCETEERNLFVRGLLQFYLQPTDKDQKANDEPIPVAETELGETEHTHLKIETEPKAVSVATKPKMIKRSVIVNQLKKILVELENADVNECEEAVDLMHCDRRLLMMLASRQLDSPNNNLEMEVNKKWPEKMSMGKEGMDWHWKPSLKPHCDLLPSRAVLIPCAGTSGPDVAMPYRQCLVGSGSDCHLCLTNYRSSSSTQSSCPYISSLHASIFYDECTGHFELLNYSEFGCRVDSIPFVNETIDKPACKIMPASLVRCARKLVDGASPTEKHKSDYPVSPDNSSSKRLKMAARRFPSFDTIHRLPGCSCTSLETSNSSEDGWEGSAILHHGSILQFGCYSFIFSLIDTTLSPPSPGPLPVTTSSVSGTSDEKRSSKLLRCDGVLSDLCILTAESEFTQS